MKKRWPSGGRVTGVPLYGGAVWLFIDREKFKQANLFLGGTGGKDGCAGLAGHFYDTKTDDQLYLIGVFNGNVGTLVHELTHCCLWIVERAGFEPGDGMGEPFCYLLDNLFAQFRDHLKRRR